MHDAEEPDHDGLTAGSDSGGVGDFYANDNIELTTVGIDMGSSTSHLMFSRLHLQRQHLTSRFVVVSRKVLHRSPILLTPYKADNTIDAEGLGAFIAEAYLGAGLTPQEVDTGAIILTGEALKRANARAIADLFASEAGKLVCASAGHNLGAVMAAHGSGAVHASAHTDQAVLNVDIGGGTCKLALLVGGEVVETAATNVGGRLVAMDGEGRVVRIEPVAEPVAEALGIELRLGEVLAPEAQRRMAEALADCLVEAFPGRSLSPLGEWLMLTPPLTSETPIGHMVFSGGVSEYVYGQATEDYGDLVRPLAEAVQSRLFAGQFPVPLRPATERIRATVIGASQFTVQVSGNTISISRPEVLPIRNLQVLHPRLAANGEVRPDDLSEAIQQRFRRFDLEEGEQLVALAIDWGDDIPTYQLLKSLAQGIVEGVPRGLAAGHPLALVFAHDCGKLVGEILREEMGVGNDIVSIDGIELRELDYIDIGEMIYPARVVPVVIKSLVFPEAHDGPKAKVLEKGAG